MGGSEGLHLDYGFDEPRLSLRLCVVRRRRARSRVRQRSPESVAAEVRELEELYGPESIRLVDDISGIDRKFFEAWADEAERLDSTTTFEPLAKTAASDLPLLEVRDSL